MITLAIDRYDRHIPFFDGTAAVPGGLDLRVLQVGEASSLRDGGERHTRFLHDGEFDAAEVSLSAFIAAVGRGLPLVGIPVFPRRLFSVGQVFVNSGAGIDAPADLAGRRIGLQSFQTTLAVLAKGDLAADYGVVFDDVRWFVKHAGLMGMEPGSSVDITLIPPSKSLPGMLAAGKLDALFYSRSPWPGGEPAGSIRRLFPDPQGEEAAYFARHGFFPIMHVIAIRAEAVARSSGLPALLMQAFQSAWDIWRGYADDPNWSSHPWTKYGLEDETERLSDRLWENGLAPNRDNLELMVRYMRDQGVIGSPLELDNLFHPSVR